MTELSNAQISDLSSCTDNLESNDFLMISEQTSQSIFTSKKVNVASLYSDINTYYSNAKNITFNATINFNENLSVTTDMINAEIKENNNETTGCQQLINFEYAKEHFFKLLDELSSKIYDEILMPSYVGQIIYSTTLRSLTNVKKRYGKNTEWKQISGRFILGVNNNETSKLGSVDQYGGEINHKLTLSEIPSHYHKFDPSNESKELKATAKLTSDASSEKIGVDSGKQIDAEDDKDSKFYAIGCVTRENKPDGAIYSEYATMFGNNGPDIEIKTFGKDNSIHNNMPPFVAMYIWERIA